MKIKGLGALGSDNSKADSKKFDLQEFVNTLNTLDPENIGSWPLLVKILIYILVFILVLILGYVFHISAMRENLAHGEEEQATLLQDFEQKVFKANNLDVYKKQLKDMEDSFGSLLRQLPQDTEVPGLLEDITHTGLGSGLDFDGIELGTEQSKEFYSELPINIKVHGDYHAFGAFVSGVSSLPRIVTLHDFAIRPVPSKLADTGAPVLSMQIQAKTYRYKEATDGSAGKKPKNAAKDAKGGA
ncbi:type IV pilus assembly protein PilO [Fluviicoccus keumensis]|uniref:Type IV pilus assembly protein PilO n=1 Tax=Fluviicoccus keumensis TaxID=1435465 RepID=A0A4Q7ZC80_9GAMM|nr:type 4a pilus biogenesis protein PilO [Fluviicoccus keumensis]RZU47469.1 type IV pilus assembly protein PilO [Fluviicoccus keumensis]